MIGFKYLLFVTVLNTIPQYFKHIWLIFQMEISVIYKILGKIQNYTFVPSNMCIIISSSGIFYNNQCKYKRNWNNLDTCGVTWIFSSYLFNFVCNRFTCAFNTKILARNLTFVCCKLWFANCLALLHAWKKNYN